MAGEYQLSYTGTQVNEKLGKIDGLETSVNQIPSTYETKTDAAAKLTEAKNYAATFAYTLPTASSTQLGGVKVGNGLNISDGLLFVNVVNNLNDTSTTSPLSANQGKILNDTITELKNNLGALGYGDMLKMTYDTDDDGIVDNSMALNGYTYDYFLTAENPVATGYLSLNRFTDNTTEIGSFSVALGYNTISSGQYSFSEGNLTTSSGIASHSEGNFTIANGDFSHAEGSLTTSSGIASHAEGSSDFNAPESILTDSTEDEVIEAWSSSSFLLAKGKNSHAEGYNTISFGDSSHAEGDSSFAMGLASHAEGLETQSQGDNSHAEGYLTISFGANSHAEGTETFASGESSHAEGSGTTSSGIVSHAEGYNTVASGEYSHAQNLGTIAQGQAQTVLGKYNTQDTTSLLIVGNGTENNSRSNAFTLDVNGNAWFAGNLSIGSDLILIATQQDISNLKNTYAPINSPKFTSSISLGRQTDSLIGINSIATGLNTVAQGDYSHSEGSGSASMGLASHAEGTGSVAIEDSSHAEGVGTTANAQASHAEGSGSTANEQASHAEGIGTTATGVASHAEGEYTIANGDYSHAQGKYNIEDNSNIYAHIVGNGTSNTNKSNAHTLDWSGNAWFAGAVYVGSSSGIDKDSASKKLITFDEIPTNISAFTNDNNYITKAELVTISNTEPENALFWIDTSV